MQIGPNLTAKISLASVAGKMHALRFVQTPMRAIVLSLLLGASAVGCSTVFIPNTEVEDTGQNRKVIQFCEEYRHAMEDKNIGKLVAMVSPAYHSRQIGTHDFVDYDRLKLSLTDEMPKTSAIRYEIKYQRVIFSEDNHVRVNYRYAASWKAAHTDGTVEWEHRVADNQLDLIPEGEGYKIIAGM